MAAESVHGSGRDPARGLVVGLFHLAFWLPLLFCTWLALTPEPPDNPVFRLGDVILHGAAFTYLTFSLMLVGTAAGRRSFTGMAVTAFIAMLGYGIFLELVQSFIPERTAELKDLGVDVAGILVGLALAAGLARPVERLVRLTLEWLLGRG